MLVQTLYLQGKIGIALKELQQRWQGLYRLTKEHGYSTWQDAIFSQPFWRRSTQLNQTKVTDPEQPNRGKTVRSNLRIENYQTAIKCYQIFPVKKREMRTAIIKHYKKEKKKKSGRWRRKRKHTKTIGRGCIVLVPNCVISICIPSDLISFLNLASTSPINAQTSYKRRRRRREA